VWGAERWWGRGVGWDGEKCYRRWRVLLHKLCRRCLHCLLLDGCGKPHGGGGGGCAAARRRQPLHCWGGQSGCVMLLSCCVMLPGKAWVCLDKQLLVCWQYTQASVVAGPPPALPATPPAAHLLLSSVLDQCHPVHQVCHGARQLLYGHAGAVSLRQWGM
jgi:hypothetical protein